MDSDSLTITTAADGTGSGKTKNMLGKLAAIVWKKTSTPVSDTVVILIKTVRTGETVFSKTLSDNEDFIVYPRIALHDTLGAAILYASGKPIYDQIPVINDELIITLTGGGNALTAKVEVLIS